MCLNGTLFTDQSTMSPVGRSTILTHIHVYMSIPLSNELTFTSSGSNAWYSHVVRTLSKALILYQVSRAGARQLSLDLTCERGLC